MLNLLADVPGVAQKKVKGCTCSCAFSSWRPRFKLPYTYDIDSYTPFECIGLVLEGLLLHLLFSIRGQKHPQFGSPANNSATLQAKGPFSPFRGPFEGRPPHCRQAHAKGRPCSKFSLPGSHGGAAYLELTNEQTSRVSM